MLAACYVSSKTHNETKGTIKLPGPPNAMTVGTTQWESRGQRHSGMRVFALTFCGAM
jgi:hypothetical protein